MDGRYDMSKCWEGRGKIYSMIKELRNSNKICVFIIEVFMVTLWVGIV